MSDEKVKSSFDKNSSMHLPVLNSADSWGQKNVLKVHITICGLASLAECNNVFPEQTVLSVFSPPKRAAASCGLDIRSSTWWLPLFQLLLSSACIDTDAQAIFWCGSIFRLSGFEWMLEATVTNNTVSCLILEIALSQEISKGLVKLCWGVVDVRSWGWSNVVVPAQVTHWSLGYG